MNKQSYLDLIDQGIIQAKRGDLQRAILYYEQAAALAHTEGDSLNEMKALDHLSTQAHNKGDYQKSIEASARLLACAQQTQNDRYRMRATFSLARTLGALDLRGRWREIKPLLLEGLQIVRTINDRHQEIVHLTWLGRWAYEVGEKEQGIAWLQEALSLIQFDTVNRSYSYGLVYNAFANVMHLRGIYTEAVRYAEMALDSFREYGYLELVCRAQLTLAHMQWQQGEKVKALQQVEQVLPLARQNGWKDREWDAEYLRGRLEWELGNLEEAEEALQQALKLAREMKLKSWEVVHLLSLGQVLLARHRSDEGREMLKQARRLSQERDYQDYFKRAERLLGENM